MAGTLAPGRRDGRARQRARLAGLSAAAGPGAHRAAHGRRLAAPACRGRQPGATAVRLGGDPSHPPWTPGWCRWLLAHRRLEAPTALADNVVSAPEPTPLAEMGRLAGSR